MEVFRSLKVFNAVILDEWTEERSTIELENRKSTCEGAAGGWK